MRSYLERLRAGSPLRSQASDRLHEAGLDHSVSAVADRQWERVLRARLQEEIHAYCAQPSLAGLAELADLLDALAATEAQDGPAALVAAREELAREWGVYDTSAVIAALDPTPVVGVSNTVDDGAERPELGL